jgi:hypothetical protein
MVNVSSLLLCCQKLSGYLINSANEWKIIQWKMVVDLPQKKLFAFNLHFILDQLTWHKIDFMNVL